MKIICRKHEGLIEVPELKQQIALDSTFGGFVFSCPVCDHQLVISSVQIDLIEQGIRFDNKSRIETRWNTYPAGTKFITDIL